MNLYFRTCRDEYRLNPELVRQQKLEQEAVKKIKFLHQIKDAILTKIEETLDRKLLPLIEDLEFRLQDAWNFERNKNHHRFWDIPGCRCPKMDNEDSYPFGYYSYSEMCPLHGRLSLQPNKL